ISTVPGMAASSLLHADAAQSVPARDCGVRGPVIGSPQEPRPKECAMQIGIGLPNTLQMDGTLVAAWAKRAEDRGFAYLATIDRIVYPTFDSLTSLAVAAGATTRIGLLTNILLAPAYPPVW